ncbi:RHS repeat-associated core domain-containing protein [Pseudomonas sp. CC120222-01a]|uniref:RHS repeat-associated core domain-containing protein n=1 Tax=Pseudomonas sp. CC120222-01a TaxID=1378075 RepID=UPI000D93753B|nr:RHS repeat-associated core domain-containing protein [Pseudomonas sp. CC120222-01a]PVZ37045.1 RHS repeat-associated protein [Pseudomonas sp. CC120222-01a]
MIIHQNFYQGSHLRTIKSRDQATSLFRHQDIPLAEKRGTNPVNLLGTGLSRSVLNSLKTSSPRWFSYTPYGYSPDATREDSSLGFNGEYRDILGLYPLGNGQRNHNSRLMRFQSPDDESPFDRGGLNAYAYCAGDPINRRDPTGHFFGLLIAIIVLVIIGLAVGIGLLLNHLVKKKPGGYLPRSERSRIRR